MGLNNLPEKTNFDLEQVILALQDYIEADNDEKRARSQYQGYSWGYYGHSYIEARDKAAAVFSEKMDGYVTGKVIEVLKKVRGLEEKNG